jgi:hypothetical protein
MQSYYRINVALNGRHFFATGEGSVTDRESAHKVWQEIVKRFPESEGFTVTVTHWQVRGQQINFSVED